MKNWESSDKLFYELNNKYVYLVMRNFEGFYDSIISDEHADIDLLCKQSDKKNIISFLDAEPRLEKNDGIHYRVLIENEYVPIDVRFNGDGYYDAEWEKNMLLSREFDSRGFFIMSKENYFWSLLYHALYHKGNISEEYYARLKSIHPELFPITKNDLERILSRYMDKNGYFYTISKDKYLWYHFTSICNGRIKAYRFYWLKKFLCKIIDKSMLLLQRGN